MKPLSSLIGRSYWRIHRSHVKLGDFRSGAFPGISHSKTYPDKAVIIALVLLQISFCQTVFVLVFFFQYERINVEIRVAERRVRQSVPKWILRLNLIFLVSPIADEKTFRVRNRCRKCDS